MTVWKLDRFARNRYDSAHYKTILKRNGVRVLSAKETISEGAEGILLESMLEGYAEYYSIELAEKVKRGLTENALKAKANGGTCTFGYTVDSDRHYQIDPPAALIVREVFQLYADGKTMKEIKDILNAKGLTNSRGKEFTFNTIQRMLSNRKYIGEYHFGEVTIPDSMPAIVDKELFEKVQQMLVKNKKAPSRHKAEDDYLLTTKLFCGHCGAIMNGESGTSHTNTTYRYYKCVNSRKKKCKKKPIAKEKIENAVIKRIMQFLEDEKAIDELVERIYELQFAENTYIPKLEEQIAETQKRIDNLIKAAEQGFVSESSAKRLKELEETKKQQEIALIQEQIKTPLFTTDQIAFAIYKFRQLDLSTREAKQALIDGFVNAIYLYDDHAKLILNYKNDTKTITLDELQGSDFNSVTAPNEHSFYGCSFILYRLYAEFSIFAFAELCTRMHIDPERDLYIAMPRQTLADVRIDAAFRAKRRQETQTMPRRRGIFSANIKKTYRKRRNSMDLKQMRWTRAPKDYTVGENKIEIVTAPHTDLWQRTYYHFRNDSAPVLQMRTAEKFFSFTVRTRFESKKRFDQCGIALYIDSENWLKASIEYENEQFQHLGSVVTVGGYSDWATTAIDASVKSMWYRLSRREDDFCIECSTDGVRFSQMRICHMPAATGEIPFGIYACSPEDSSFRATFTDFTFGECLWKAHVGQPPDKE